MQEHCIPPFLLLWKLPKLNFFFIELYNVMYYLMMLRDPYTGSYLILQK